MAPQVARSVGPPQRGPASLAGAGVPLSVQSAVPYPRGCLDPHERRAPCPGRAGPVLVYRVIAAFSRPGDLVATAGIGALTLAAAATAAERTALIVSPGTQQRGRALLAVTAACPCPTNRLAGLGPDDPRRDDAIVACAQALRPGGLLAVLTSAACAPGLPGQVVARAQARSRLHPAHRARARRHLRRQARRAAAPATPLWHRRPRRRAYRPDPFHGTWRTCT